MIAQQRDHAGISQPPDDVRQVWRSLRIVLVLIAALCAVHITYLALSRMVPSTDEAHYMSGALSIVEGIRTGTVVGAWNGYINALGFKAPLVCVPAAAFMLLFGGLTQPCEFSLVATFAVLGLGAYRLFTRCLRPSVAICATVLLLTGPMITGLTHRFYVELLLLAICVWCLDLLWQNPWTTTPTACLLGLAMGLGFLCKLTFGLLIALPALYSLYAWRAAITKSSAQVLKFIMNTALAGAIILATAGPWYSRNFSEVWKHSQIAAAAESCFYPHWVQMDLSAGPGLLVAAAALIALFPVARDIWRGRIASDSARCWVLVLLLGISTAIACAVTINKATRFFVTALPAFALLSAALWDYLPIRWLRRRGGYVLAVISTLLCLEICFGVPPIRPVRAGDLILIDSRYPLNVPGWYDDVHPVDRRDFQLEKVDDIIARDAANRFPLGHAIHARITEFGLLINFDHLGLLSRAAKHSIQYLPWEGGDPSGPDSPEYFIAYKGFRTIYPGVHFFEYYPNLEQDAASNRIPYQKFAQLDGPENTHILFFAKRALVSLAGSGNKENQLIIEAESFNRGNATIDRGEFGYGRNIGVIISQRPPPTFVEYDFVLPRDGEYQIELRYASAAQRAVRLLVDHELVSSRAAESITGGFGPESQKWQPVGTIFLKRGKHTLRLESDFVFPHIDQILLASRK